MGFLYRRHVTIGKNANATCVSERVWEGWTRQMLTYSFSDRLCQPDLKLFALQGRSHQVDLHRQPCNLITDNLDELNYVYHIYRSTNRLRVTDIALADAQVADFTKRKCNCNTNVNVIMKWRTGMIQPSRMWCEEHAGSLYASVSLEDNGTTEADTTGNDV
jgi:hypothetical protein